MLLAELNFIPRILWRQDSSSVEEGKNDDVLLHSRLTLIHARFVSVGREWVCLIQSLHPKWLLFVSALRARVILKVKAVKKWIFLIHVSNVIQLNSNKWWSTTMNWIATKVILFLIHIRPQRFERRFCYFWIFWFVVVSAIVVLILSSSSALLFCF